MTKAKTVGILAGILTAATYAGTAGAAEHDGYGSAGLLLGFGVPTSSNQADVNPAGFGLGVRGGYTLPFNLYLGGTFVYHLGGSRSTPVGDYSMNVLYFGVEAGYDIEAGPVIIRPYLGLGDLIGVVSVPEVCLPAPFGGCFGGSDSASAFGLWPGAAVLYPIDNFFIGGDTRFVISTDNSDFTVWSLFATGGMKF
jgi:hypothetical protein